MFIIIGQRYKNKTLRLRSCKARNFMHIPFYVFLANSCHIYTILDFYLYFQHYFSVVINFTVKRGVYQ